MKRHLWLLIAVTAISGSILVSCSLQSQDVSVGASVTTDSDADYSSPSVSLFYDELEPYGRWFNYGSYGWCWTPYDVPAGWRPYHDGHWNSTELGWTWVADEEWGWAPYHYGRWFYDGDYGWVWVPDTVWSPAWVAWRYDDDYIGWAPLPPGTDWRAGVEVTWTNGDFDRQIEPQSWCFVPSRSLLDVSLGTRIVPEPMNTSLIGRTTFSVRFQEQSGRPANVGLDPSFAERRLGHPLPHQRIVDLRRPTRNGGARAGLGFYRPEFRAEPSHAPVAEADDRRPDPAEERRVQARRDADQRRIEEYYDRQQRDLEMRQRQEDQQRSGPDADDQVRRQRHDQERQELDQARDRDRKVLEARYRKNLYKPERASRPGRGRDRGGINTNN